MFPMYLLIKKIIIQWLVPRGATHLIMTGNPLEIKLLLVLGKLEAIGTLIASLIVIMFDIGQSAGKIPKYVNG